MKEEKNRMSDIQNVDEIIRVGMYCKLLLKENGKPMRYNGMSVMSRWKRVNCY